VNRLHRGLKWLSLLGLNQWLQRSVHRFTARSRAAVAEGAIALEDRIALARLEWAEHKRRLLQLVALAAALGVLVVATLLLVALAVLVQFWDTPYRLLVVWLLAALGVVACATLSAWLLAGLRRAENAFALTRRELATDWHILKTRLQEPQSEQAP